VSAEPHISTVMDFAGHAFDGVEGWFNLYASHPSCWPVIWSFPTNDLSGVRTMMRDLGDLNQFFGAATRNRQLWTLRGGRQDCLQMLVFFADVDIADSERHQGEKNYPASREAALALVSRFPLPPTVIVWTGGGLHVYWKLAPALSIPDAEPLLARLKVTLSRLAAQSGVEIDNVFEPARMMRLPGSVNYKATPVPVEIIFSDWTRTYRAGDWRVVLDELPRQPRLTTITSTRTKFDRRSALRLRGDSNWPERDEFNAGHSVEDVLLDAGWCLHRATPQRTEYVRPGKTTEGVSATVYADRPDRVVWSDAAGLPSQRGFDAWGLNVHLHFNGDFAAATQDARLKRFGRWQQRTTSHHGGLRLRRGL
jgi:hypothetical protein